MRRSSRGKVLMETVWRPRVLRMGLQVRASEARSTRERSEVMWWNVLVSIARSGGMRGELKFSL